jgi:hypothetical protein
MLFQQLNLLVLGLVFESGSACIKQRWLAGCAAEGRHIKDDGFALRWLMSSDILLRYDNCCTQSL